MKAKGRKPENFSKYRERLYEVFLETEIRRSQWFFVVLLVTFVVIILESLPGLSPEWSRPFNCQTWFLIVFFTIEYMVNSYTGCKPFKISFYDI